MSVEEWGEDAADYTTPAYGKARRFRQAGGLHLLVLETA